MIDIGTRVQVMSGPWEGYVGRVRAFTEIDIPDVVKSAIIDLEQPTEFSGPYLIVSYGELDETT